MKKTYFVTGANRGIGFAFCKHLLSLGHKVFAASRSTSNRDQLNTLKDSYKNEITLLDLDVENDRDIASLKEILAGEKIDALLNIAGIFDLPDKDFESDGSSWEKMFRVNTIGPIILAESLLPNLKKSSNAIVVNMSSDMGSIELNTNAIYTPYRASKAALNAITKSQSIQWRPDNITVISMHPGWVRTDMGGPDGQLSPEESVQMMYDIIHDLSIGDTGKFLSYLREELPW